MITMDYPSRGLPHMEGEFNSDTNTETMDIPSRGLPFVANRTAAAVGGGATHPGWQSANGWW